MTTMQYRNYIPGYLFHLNEDLGLQYNWYISSIADLFIIDKLETIQLPFNGLMVKQTGISMST